MQPFKAPHKLVMNEKKGMQEVDLAQSEEYRLLEAFGTPRIYYALKANKYFKDVDCTKEFSDTEILALELPIPAEIASERQKLVEKANDAGETANMTEILRATAPTEVLSPKRIRDKLVNKSAEDRMIDKINRSIVGR